MADLQKQGIAAEAIAWAESQGYRARLDNQAGRHPRILLDFPVGEEMVTRFVIIPRGSTVKRRSVKNCIRSMKGVIREARAERGYGPENSALRGGKEEAAVGKEELRIEEVTTFRVAGHTFDDRGQAEAYLKVARLEARMRLDPRFVGEDGLEVEYNLEDVAEWILENSAELTSFT